MNNLDNINTLLTESAKEKIAEILESKKQELLSKAYDIASKNETENIEISLRDILEANDEGRNAEIKYRNSAYRRKRMSYLLAITGAFYAIIGFAIYFYQNSDFNLKSDLGLIMVVAGIFISFMAFFFNQFYSLKTLRSQVSVKVKDRAYFPSLDYAVVERWQIIEKLVRKNFEKNEDDKKTISFSQLLKYLSENYAETDQDFKDIKMLLTARNEIVHDSHKYSDSKRIELINIADGIINKLEKQ